MINCLSFVAQRQKREREGKFVFNRQRTFNSFFPPNSTVNCEFLRHKKREWIQQFSAGCKWIFNSLPSVLSRGRCFPAVRGAMTTTNDDYEKRLNHPFCLLSRALFHFLWKWKKKRKMIPWKLIFLMLSSRCAHDRVARGRSNKWKIIFYSWVFFSFLASNTDSREEDANGIWKNFIHLRWKFTNSLSRKLTSGEEKLPNFKFQSIWTNLNLE